MEDERQMNPELSPTRKVVGAVAVFYVAALLLNAEGLLRNAQRLPYGPFRQQCLKLIEPVAGVAKAVGATQLRTGIERMMNGTKGAL